MSKPDEVRLWLSVIPTLSGRLALPRRIGNWSLTSLQHRLVKTGGRLVKHARYYWLLLAEGHLTRRLFGSMVRMIAALPQFGPEVLWGATFVSGCVSAVLMSRVREGQANR